MILIFKILEFLSVFFLSIVDLNVAQQCTATAITDGNTYNCPALESAPGRQAYKNSDYSRLQCPVNEKWLFWYAGLNQDGSLYSLYGVCCADGSAQAGPSLTGGGIMRYWECSKQSNNLYATPLIIGGSTPYVGANNQYSLTSFFDQADQTKLGDPAWGYFAYTVFISSTTNNIIGFMLFHPSQDIIQESAGLLTDPNLVMEMYTCPYGTKISGFSYTFKNIHLQSISALCTASLCNNKDPYPRSCGCPVGTYSSDSATYCLVCPVGTFGDSQYLTVCVASIVPLQH